MLGAAIGAAILGYNNYYQVVRERNALQDEVLRRREGESTKKERESLERLTAAKTRTEEARKIEEAAKERIRKSKGTA